MSEKRCRLAAGIFVTRIGKLSLETDFFHSAITTVPGLDATRSQILDLVGDALRSVRTLATP